MAWLRCVTFPLLPLFVLVGLFLWRGMRAAALR